MSEVDLKEIKASGSLDARGLGCPMPLLKAKKAMEALNSGEVLEVVGSEGEAEETDDPNSDSPPVTPDAEPKGS